MTVLAFPEFEARHGGKKHADLTPLIDVIFNLLLFYLLASSVTLSSFLVNLPAADGADANPPPGHTLSLSRSGDLLWDGRAISRDDLIPVLSASRPERLSLEADAEVPFGLVTELMDLTRRSGFKEISFTMREKTP